MGGHHASTARPLSHHVKFLRKIHFIKGINTEVEFGSRSKHLILITFSKMHTALLSDFNEMHDLEPQAMNLKSEIL